MYLIMAARGETARIITTVPEEMLRARFPDKHRTKRVIEHGGLAFREVEATGEKIRTSLQLSTPRPEREQRKWQPQPMTATGHESRVQCYATLSKVDARIRRMHPDDEAVLAALDRILAEREAYVSDARRTRREHVNAAWRRVRKSVGPRELEALAERTATPA